VSSGRRVAKVVLDTRLPQLDRLFDYSIPDGLALQAGVRVRVPLRNQTRLSYGWVVELADTSDHSGALVDIAEMVSKVPVLSPELWSLASAIAQRQAGSAADVLRLAIPPRYVRVEKSWLARDPSLVGTSTMRAPRASVEGFPPETWSAMVEPRARTALYLPHGTAQAGSNTVPQGCRAVIAVAQEAFARAQSTIIVVPTWRDIEHYLHALESALESADESSMGAVVVLRADGSPSERYGNFLRGLESAPIIILGTRHAVYAPAPNLGAIVVVDDGDDAHREPLAPYPHTRDVALLRHQGEGCAVVFASLLPSLSVKRWIDQGYLSAVAPAASARPRVVLTELSVGADRDRAPARLPSAAFQAAKEALRLGPVLIQVFRSGFSTGLACATCNERGMCHTCHGPLRLPQAQARPVCSWCGVVHVAWRCALCGGNNLVPRGQGIGRTMSDIGRAFPTVPVIQSDASHRVVSVSDQPAVVIATRGSEPVAEGGYRLALLLDGGAMLSRESLRALEDSLHAWENAISLVRPEGAAYVTEVSGNPAMALASGRFEQLLSEEITERTALRLPPTVRLASITGPAELVTKAREALETRFSGLDVLGPVGMEDATVRIIIRFPYAGGDLVTQELRALRNKLALGTSRGRSLRLHIVIDDPDRLDALMGE